MDRIDRIGPRSPQWLHPAIDPDADDLAERRRREQERRRREQQEAQQPPPPPADDDPPHHIDVRA